MLLWRLAFFGRQGRGEETELAQGLRDWGIEKDPLVWVRASAELKGRFEDEKPGWLRFKVSQVRNCEAPPPHGPRPVRGDPGPGTRIFCG